MILKMTQRSCCDKAVFLYYLLFLLLLLEWINDRNMNTEAISLGQEKNIYTWQKKLGIFVCMVK